MNSYLYFVVDSIPLLIDVDNIAEIVSFTQSDIPDHWSWKGRTIPVSCLRNLLSRSSELNHRIHRGLVCRVNENRDSTLLLVDEIIDVVTLGADALHPLPRITSKLSQCIDTTYLDEIENRQVYHFRNPFPLERMLENTQASQ